MPRYRATDTILLDRQRHVAGDVFETAEEIGSGLVAAGAATRLEVAPPAPASPTTAPAKPRRKTRA